MGWMTGQRTIHTSVKHSKPWAFALRWRCRPMMHSRDWRGIDTRPSSQTWDVWKDLARGTCCLDRLRQQGDQTPLFFYASSNAPEHKRETREHGGQGCTNNAQELFEMVTKAVVRRQTA